MTESDLTALRELISRHAGADAKSLSSALDDLLRTIAAQSLFAVSLTRELRNHRVGDEALGALARNAALDHLLAPLALPRQTPFTLAEAEAAGQDLARAARDNARAGDLAAVLSAIVKIVRVFTL